MHCCRNVPLYHVKHTHELPLGFPFHGEKTEAYKGKGICLQTQSGQSQDLNPGLLLQRSISSSVTLHLSFQIPLSLEL